MIMDLKNVRVIHMVKVVVISISYIALFLSPLFVSFLSESQAESKDDVIVSGATIVNCGEIEAAPSVAAQEEQQTKHGYVFVMDELETPKFKPGCPEVRAEIGNRFGIQVQVNGSPDSAVADIMTRWTHPIIRNPDTGREGSVDEWKSPMSIGYARYAGWQFDEPWELIPGKWKVEIIYRDKVLASKEFEVTLPEK